MNHESEDLGVHSPQNDSVEDSYIMQTSVAPSAIYSQQFPTLLIGSSVEAIILDLIKQVEVCSFNLCLYWIYNDLTCQFLQDKIVNGEESLCIDPLNDETYFIENDVDTRTIRDPPAIQVDMPSGIIGDRRITNQHPNCFFYLSTLPMSLQPIVILRVLQHRMFGCFAYWAWHSNAVSRASVASAGGSSIEFNRSRASSNASNANFEISNAFGLKRNINLHCSNVSLSPGRIESERHPSLKGNSIFLKKIDLITKFGFQLCRNDGQSANITKLITDWIGYITERRSHVQFIVYDWTKQCITIWE